MSKKILIITIVIVVLATAIRCIGLNRPLLGNFYARQIEDAMIAKSYIRNHFNILKPAINNIVDGSPGLLLTNFHLYSYMVALFSELFHINIDFAGRLLSVVFSLFCGLYLYRLTFYFTGRKCAIAALFLYLFSPMSIIYGQNFQAESLGLFLLVFSVYYFVRFVNHRSLRSFLFAFISGALVFLVKIPWLPLYLLFFWIYFLRCRINRTPLLKRADVLLLLGLMIIPVIAWLGYIYNMRTSPGVFITIFDEASSGKVVLKSSYFTNPEFYKRLSGYIITLILNPIGLILFLISFFVTKERFFKGLFGGWLVLVLFYCFLIPKKVFEQNYYFFPAIPAMAIYAASGFDILKDRVFCRITPHYRRWILLLSPVFILASLRYSLAPSFITPDEFKYAVYAGSEIARHTAEGDLVITSSGGKGYLLYYSDRFGWDFDASKDTNGKSGIEKLESLREKGASYFAADYPALNFKNRDLKEYIFRCYWTILDNEKILLFNIRERKPRYVR